MAMCKPCLIIALLFALVVVGSVMVLWKNAFAQTTTVIINEIAWMGTTASANDEWIELYNTSGVAINLEGWSLKTQDGSPEINLVGIIPTNGYFLLERTNDSSAPRASADQIYTGALKNDGEILSLYNSSGAIIDAVNASSGWPAGDNSTKETMARKDMTAWMNGPIGGTPRAANYSSQENNTQTNIEESGTNDESTPLPTESKVGPDEQILKTTDENSNTDDVIPAQTFTKTESIIINEFLPNPTGSDAELEWIEIYNTANESYDISRWQLDDAEDGSAPFTLAQGTIIAPHGYLIFSRITTRIALNNTDDEVRLLYPDGTVAHEVKYTDGAKDGYAYALIDTQWRWTSVLTPGSANIPDSPKSNTSGPQEKSTPPISSKTNNEKGQKKELAETGVQTLSTPQFSAQLAQKSSFSPGIILIFLSAGIISAIAGVGFVLMKNKAR